MVKRSEFLSGPPRLGLAEVRDRIQKAILLAGATLFISFPMFYSQYQRLIPILSSRPFGTRELNVLAMGNSLFLFAGALLSALVGFLYAERLALPGFGKVRDLETWLPLGLAVGLLLTPLSYYLFDRRLLAQAPELYPPSWTWALARMAGTVMTQEVVVRFGLLTIGVYLLRWRGYQGHPWPAVLLISIFAVASSAVFSYRFQMAERVAVELFIGSLVSTFLLQWILSEVYWRKGFLAAAGFHLGFTVKLLVLSLLITPH